MDYLGYILLSLVILLFMVLIHELGHYTAAKILGFTVEEFSVGFGPKLFSRRRKNGELFSLRAFPLGGFCSFLGETDDDTPEAAPEAKTAVNKGRSEAQAEAADNKNEDLLSYVMRAKLDEDKAREKERAEQVKALKEEKEEKPIRLDKNGNPALTFYRQKPWKRIIVLLGGVLFNFLSAIVFSFIYIWAVGYPAPHIAEVYNNPDGVPYSQLMAGDIILGVDGKNISVMKSYAELTENVAENQTVTFKVDRAGSIIDVRVTRQTVTTVDKDGKPSVYVGFGFATGYEYIGGSAGNGFKYCVPYTFKLSWSILGSFGRLITGKVPITSVSGPVGSIKLMADVSRANPINILILLPLLASNLAMFNILPFPALDGAQIVFTVIEWIRKKPINRKVQGIINMVGLGVLLLFVVIVDILSWAL